MNRLGPKPRKRRIYLLGSLILLAALAWWFWGREPQINLPLSFNGDSASLTRTQIVPTLDTPIEKGKNVIWSASSTAAWKQLQKSLGGELLIENAEAASQRLTAAPDPTPDCPPGTIYANAGRVSGGIIQAIGRDVPAQFAGESAPQFGSVSPDDLIAYALLRVKAKFTIPFFDDRLPFEFKSSTGNTTQIHAFGLRQKDDYAYPDLRAQVEILYSDWPGAPQEFILDLCRDSQPAQVLIARIPQGATLEETLMSMEMKIAQGPTAVHSKNKGMGTNDVMLIPRIAWRIVHHDKQFEGHDVIANGVSQPLVEVVDDIEFHLERGGMELRSESKRRMRPSPTRYLANGPFMVVARTRGATRPFFVLWIDNDELLTPMK